MSDEPKSIGRDGAGRFAKGNRAAAGHKSPVAARNAVAYKLALLEAVDPQQIVGIFRKLIALAEQGDTTAAGIVLDRVMGRAVQPLEVTGDPVQQQSIVVQQLLADRELLQEANALAKRINGGAPSNVPNAPALLPPSGKEH